MKILTFLTLTLFFAVGPVGPVDTAYGQNSDIDYFRTEAENARAYAAKLRAQADQWRRRAEDAREQAKKANKALDRESWLDDARHRQERADAAALDADKAKAKAVKAEAKLRQASKELEKSSTEVDSSSPLEPVKKDSISKPVMPLEDVIGVWKINAPDSIFVIVQEEPDLAGQAYKLEAHTGPRVWKGYYTPFEEGNINRIQNARVIFKYTPKFDEMNPEIPEWARKRLEGQLEWEIELDEPQSCGSGPALDGKFFPGKVKWDEKNKVVKIDGRGEPRPMTLSLQQFEPEDAYVSTSIRIRPPGLGGQSDDVKTGELLPFAPLQVLVEGQLFHVDISLSYELAEKQGEKLTIKLRGLSGDEKETVELIRGVFRRGRPSIYTNYRPLFFGDSKTFLSQSWQNEVGDHPQRVDLDLENGESVAIGFDKTFEIMPVYMDIEEYAVAKYLEAAGYLEKLHRYRLVMPGAPKEDREDAYVRLRRLKNFQILMNNPDNPNWLRVMIAEEYLGPVREASQVMYDPQKIFGEGQIRVSNVNVQVVKENAFTHEFWPNELNEWEKIGDNDRQHRFDSILWTNRYERQRVTQLVSKAWRERVRKAFDVFMIDITFGLYEWALSEMSVGTTRFRIGVADLFALTGDIDHYGRKLPKGKKLEIISGVLLSNLTDYAGDELRDNMLDESFGYQAPGDKLLTIKNVAQALRGRNIERRKVKLTPPPGSQKKPKLPDSLGDEKIKLVAPTLATNDDIDGSTPLSCPAPPRAGSSSSPEPDSVGKAITVAQRYGENAVVTRRDAPDARQQEFGTCQAEAVLNGAGVDMNPIAVLRLMAENSKEFAQKLRTVSREDHPLIRGFTEGEMQLLAGLLGRETKLLPSGKIVSMRVLEGLRENGWSIKIAINAEDYTGLGDNKHAVDIVGFKQDPAGCGILVTVYDKDLGASITMPVEDLRNRLAEWPVMLHRDQEGATVPKNLTKSEDGSPPPRAKIKIDEFDELPRRTVHNAIEILYPGGKGAMPINTVSREVHERIKNGANWEQPKGGGASFSPSNVGTLRQGDIAIRINPDSQQHIRWENDSGGLVPNYTVPIGREAGQVKSYIHPEHLQYLDPSIPGKPKWQSYGPGKHSPMNEGRQ